jgi:hypothetical protein
VETALVLPILVLLTLGLLQLGRLLWLRVQLQHAAQAAARAYTVWWPEDENLALEKARAAAWLSLRPQVRLRRLDLEPRRWNPRPSSFKNESWLQSGASLTQGVIVRLELDPWPGLGFIFPGGPVLRAEASILNEESRARAEIGRQGKTQNR